MNENEVQEQLNRIEEKVSQLHEVVTTLLGGIAQAQQSGGMAGMMARQFPDVTGFMTAPAGQTPGV